MSVFLSLFFFPLLAHVMFCLPIWIYRTTINGQWHKIRENNFKLAEIMDLFNWFLYIQTNLTGLIIKTGYITDEIGNHDVDLMLQCCSFKSYGYLPCICTKTKMVQMLISWLNLCSQGPVFPNRRNPDTRSGEHRTLATQEWPHSNNCLHLLRCVTIFFDTEPILWNVLGCCSCSLTSSVRTENKVCGVQHLLICCNNATGSEWSWNQQVLK